MAPSPLHLANLSRGLLCPVPFDLRVRIQSTALEQGRWGEVLWAFPDEGYAALAEGRTVVLHDKSERPRLTRAQWQGVPWITYALLRSRGERPEKWRLLTRQRGRGHNVEPFFDEVWRGLDKGTRGRLRYHAREWGEGVLVPCACWVGVGMGDFAVRGQQRRAA